MGGLRGAQAPSVSEAERRPFWRTCLLCAAGGLRPSRALSGPGLRAAWKPPRGPGSAHRCSLGVKRVGQDSPPAASPRDFHRAWSGAVIAKHSHTRSPVTRQPGPPAPAEGSAELANGGTPFLLSPGGSPPGVSNLWGPGQWDAGTLHASDPSVVNQASELAPLTTGWLGRRLTKSKLFCRTKPPRLSPTEVSPQTCSPPGRGPVPGEAGKRVRGEWPAASASGAAAPGGAGPVLARAGTGPEEAEFPELETPPPDFWAPPRPHPVHPTAASVCPSIS